MSANLGNSEVATGLEKASQFSFQSQRKARPSNVQITIQLHSFHMLARYCSKSFKLGFNSTRNKKVQMCKLDLKRQRNQKSNCQHLLDHQKAREFQENIYFWFIDYAKAFDCVDHNKLWKILKEMGIPYHLTCLLRNLYAGQEATWNNGLVPNRKQSTSRLYIVTLLI